MTVGASRALGWLTVLLLVADAALAWLAIQATFVFLELVWRGLAGRENWSPILQAHVQQFQALRALQAAAWLLTAGVFLAWLHAVRAVLARDAGRTLRDSPASAVAAFLVPGRIWCNPYG